MPKAFMSKRTARGERRDARPSYTATLGEWAEREAAAILRESEGPTDGLSNYCTPHTRERSGFTVYGNQTPLGALAESLAAFCALEIS